MTTCTCVVNRKSTANMRAFFTAMNLAAQKVTFIIKKAIVQKQLQWKQV